MPQVSGMLYTIHIHTCNIAANIGSGADNYIQLIIPRIIVFWILKGLNAIFLLILAFSLLSMGSYNDCIGEGMQVVIEHLGM